LAPYSYSTPQHVASSGIPANILASAPAASFSIGIDSDPRIAVVQYKLLEDMRTQNELKDLRKKLHVQNQILNQVQQQHIMSLSNML
jgi:hypothetical protein